MELVYSRDFPIETVYVDRFGRLKPSMILYFAQEVAADHCEILGCDWDACLMLMIAINNDTINFSQFFHGISK